jgi:hypothetical protein
MKNAFQGALFVFLNSLGIKGRIHDAKGFVSLLEFRETKQVRLFWHQRSLRWSQNDCKFINKQMKSLVPKRYQFLYLRKMQSKFGIYWEMH